jgi:SAM-dependent methyltransferase
VTSSDLAFTGERFIPGAPGEIAHEHWHRYAFARRLVAGRRVADVACGEGYGSALLATSAASVVGVDLDAAAIAHATATYARPSVRFVMASATALPLADGSVDAVVSFETIEHIPADAQAAMLAEFARIVAPGGVLVMSSPNRPEYSERRGYRNPYHLHELDRDELTGLLADAFPAQRWFRQRRYVGSVLWAEEGTGAHEALAGDAHSVAPARPPEALYFVVVAARDAASLPPADVALSMFTDTDESEWARLDAQAREVLRLDGLLRERDAALTRQAHHVQHLEGLVAYRDAIVVERDAQIAGWAAARDDERAAWSRREAELRAADAEARASLASAHQAIAALEAERRRLENAIGAQERIISYRQSARWWLQLPWLRVRNLWQRLT